MDYSGVVQKGLQEELSVDGVRTQLGFRNTGAGCHVVPPPPEASTGQL